MFWVTYVALLLRPSGHKGPADRRTQRRPSEDREAGPGGGGAGGPQPRGRRAAQRRQQGGGRGRGSSLTSHSQLRLQTCSSPPPPHPGPPACPPARPPFCLLSPSVLDGPGPFPGSGYLVSIGAGGAGAGGCGGVAGLLAWGAGPGLRSPLSPALPRRPHLPPVGALLAGLCAASGAAAARGAALVASGGKVAGGEEGGEGRLGPRPNMAEVTIDQSKLPGVKEGRGRGARRAGPLPSPSLALFGRGRRPFGPRGPRAGASGAPALVGGRIDLRRYCGTLGESLLMSPVSSPRGNGGREDSTTLRKWLCKMFSRRAKRW